MPDRNGSSPAVMPKKLKINKPLYNARMQQQERGKTEPRPAPKSAPVSPPAQRKLKMRRLGEPSTEKEEEEEEGVLSILQKKVTAFLADVFTLEADRIQPQNPPKLTMTSTRSKPASPPSSSVHTPSLQRRSPDSTAAWTWSSTTSSTASMASGQSGSRAARMRILPAHVQ